MRRARIIIALLALALAVAMPQMALALGTTAGTTVNNSAQLSYSVGTSNLSITNTTSFVVDRKVNFTVAKDLDGTPALQPGVFNSAIEFSIDNLGNYGQGFMLQAIYNGPGSTMVAVDNLQIYVDDGDGNLEIDTDDTLYVDATSLSNIPADGTRKVWIVGDAPAGIVDGQYAEYWLIANATDFGTTTLAINTPGANTAGMDTVLADDAGGISALTVADITYNNVYSASGTFTVSAAVISFSKSATLVWDPINNDNGNQKAIPGAYIEYVLIINNTGASSAMLSQIQDTLSTTSAADGVNLINYMDTLGATPASSTGKSFVVTCVTPVGARACDAGTSHSPNSDGITYGGDPNGLITINLTADPGILPVEDVFVAGEIKGGDLITIKYMVQIVQ